MVVSLYREQVFKKNPIWCQWAVARSPSRCDDGTQVSLRKGKSSYKSLHSGARVSHRKSRLRLGGVRRTLWVWSTVMSYDFWWWGSSPVSVPGYFGDEGVCGVGFWEETLFLFLGRWYRGWELLRVIRTLEVWSGSQDTELSILYKQSLQWWFHCMWLTLVQVYVPQEPPQEAPVVFGYIEVSCERYTPSIYRYIRGCRVVCLSPINVDRTNLWVTIKHTQFSVVLFISLMVNPLPQVLDFRIWARRERPSCTTSHARSDNMKEIHRACWYSFTVSPLTCLRFGSPTAKIEDHLMEYWRRTKSSKGW